MSEMYKEMEVMKRASAKDRESREKLEEEQRKLRAEMAQSHLDLRKSMATWKKQVEADAKVVNDMSGLQNRYSLFYSDILSSWMLFVVTNSKEIWIY